MSVDMYEHRFRSELEKLPAFTPNDVRDQRVWDRDFPAWHALFSAMCLFGHSTGYRLFSYEAFFEYCEKAYARRHTTKSKELAAFFSGDLLPGMRQRVSAWYESGMAETYLYVCLVQAIEDKAKVGVVLYDPRADWKLKADVIVIVNRRPLRVSAFVGERADRAGIEARRDGIERDRKKNTMESSHWHNAELEAMELVTINRTDSDMQIINGLRLFSLPSVNALLTSIYDAANVEPESRWLFP